MARLQECRYSMFIFALLFTIVAVFSSFQFASPSFASDGKYHPELTTTKRSASFLWDHGVNSFSNAWDWFLGGDFHWAKGVNDFITRHINEIVAMPFSLVMAAIELIFNFFIHYVPAVFIAAYGLVMMVFGALLLPILWIWNMFLDIFSRG